MSHWQKWQCEKNSFKHAAWSKDSILCFWRRHIVCNYHRTGRCQGNVTSLPLTLYRSRSCADVLRGEHADVTDFFLMTLMDTSVVKHNMLKGEEHFHQRTVFKKIQKWDLRLEVAVEYFHKVAVILRNYLSASAISYCAILFVAWLQPLRKKRSGIPCQHFGFPITEELSTTCTPLRGSPDIMPVSLTKRQAR